MTNPLAPKILGTFGRYELLERIGMGGMAEVWLAQISAQSGFQKRLVLKTIQPYLAESPEFVRMFLKEASLAARLNHPNIVQIYELGDIEGRHFIAMEYIPGRSLRQMRARVRKKGAPEASSKLPPWFVLNTVARACDGLHYSHDLCDHDGTHLGLVHRDISPENIMVSFAGGVKLLDFGVAKMSAIEQTHSKTLVGKFGYMSPQQARGERTDLRTDIYAIGVILYELFTGEKPFQGTNEAVVLHNTVQGKYAPPQEVDPSIPDELSRIIVKAMAYEPENRHQSAAELQSEILAFVWANGMACDQSHLGIYVSSLFPESTEIPAYIRNSIGGFKAQNSDPPSSSTPPFEPTPGHRTKPGLPSRPGTIPAAPPPPPTGPLSAKPPSVKTKPDGKPAPPPPSGKVVSKRSSVVPTRAEPSAPLSVPKPPPVPNVPDAPDPNVLELDWPDVDGQEILSVHTEAKVEAPKLPADSPTRDLSALRKEAVADKPEPPPAPAAPSAWFSDEPAAKTEKTGAPLSPATLFSDVPAASSRRPATSDVWGSVRIQRETTADVIPSPPREEPKPAVLRWGDYETTGPEEAPPQQHETAASGFERGLALVREKKLEEAALEWERALAEDPQNRSLQVNLQRLRERLKAK